MAELLFLRIRIETMRKRLLRLAEKHGLGYPLVLAMSRRLDGLMVEYMRKIGKARPNTMPKAILDATCGSRMIDMV